MSCIECLALKKRVDTPLPVPTLRRPQAVADVLCPLLERRYAAEGARHAAALRQQLQAVERDALEVRRRLYKRCFLLRCCLCQAEGASAARARTALLQADASHPAGARC